jgi:predicted nucleic acid-binding protein
MVIDASVFVAMPLDEDIPADVQDAFGRTTIIHLLVPPLWFWEVSNTAVVASRRARTAWAEMEIHLGELLNLPIQVDEQSLHEALKSTARIAIEHGLTTHDAAYLEIALRRALPLATLDRRLGAAARKVGAEVIGTPS